jgi:hypothetical protein
MEPRGIEGCHNIILSDEEELVEGRIPHNAKLADEEEKRFFGRP